MKKYLLISALGLAGLFYGQNYPNHNYPNNGGYENNGWGYGQDAYYDGVDPYAYGTYDYSNANFPDDYYYDYPTDYYPVNYYQGYYNDYRNSIVGINWNNFFVEFRLNPYQIREIARLNNRFSSFSVWYSYYGMNPDRWYYDRFYALQRILGAKVYIVFRDRYYRGHDPFVYFQNYRRSYYETRYNMMPRYRNVDINAYRVDRGRFFENHRNHYGWSQPSNLHSNSGFRTEGDNPRNGNDGNNNNHSAWRNPRNNGYQGNGNGQGVGVPRNNGSHSGGNSGNRGSGGFRDPGGSRQDVGGFRSGGSQNREGGRSNSRDFGNRSTSK